MTPPSWPVTPPRLAGDTTQDSAEDTTAATPRARSFSAAAAGTCAAFADAAADTAPACAADPQFRESGEFGPGRKQDGRGPG